MRKRKEKPRKHKRSLSIKDKFDIYWRRHKNKLSPEKLILIVLRADHFLTRKRALIEFLTRNNLNFAHFYDMLNAAKDILENNKNLNSQFLKDLFDISTGDQLLELAEEKMPEAIKELFGRIDAGFFGNRKSLQILIRYFDESTNSKIRTALWKKIKKFDPTEKDLRYLLDLPMMYALPKITSEIQKMLRKSNKKKETRTIEKIKEFIKQIKQGQE